MSPCLLEVLAAPHKVQTLSPLIHKPYTMSTPISWLLAPKPRKGYVYTIFTPDFDDECFICMSPYTSQDSCHPIRQMDLIFAPRKAYAHTPFIPTPNVECFICKEPYDSTGCHPNRLIECRYVMGLECFTECMKRTPKKCPYDGHKLCATYQLDKGSSLVSILAWPCSTRLFRCMDPFNHRPFSVSHCSGA
jgi:hypothetical protein